MLEAVFEEASQQIQQGEAEGVLLFSDEVRAQLTIRELDLIQQAFRAGVQVGKRGGSR